MSEIQVTNQSEKFLERLRERLDLSKASQVDVIPLGLERRVLSLGGETTIVSPDHEPIVLPVGQYLLYHPRPSRDRVD